jgi:hypothetical protein
MQQSLIMDCTVSDKGLEENKAIRSYTNYKLIREFLIYQPLNKRIELIPDPLIEKEYIRIMRSAKNSVARKVWLPTIRFEMKFRNMNPETLL